MEFAGWGGTFLPLNIALPGVGVEVQGPLLMGTTVSALAPLAPRVMVTTVSALALYP